MGVVSLEVVEHAVDGVHAGSALAMQELEDGLSMLEGEIEDKEHATQLMRWVLGLINDGEHATHS